VRGGSGEVQGGSAEVLRGHVQVRRRCSDLKSGSEDSHPAAAVRNTSAGQQVHVVSALCFFALFSSCSPMKLHWFVLVRAVNLGATGLSFE
jgi:hypothetical protein